MPTTQIVTPYEALPADDDSLMMVGGLTAQTWQITVWILVAAVFGGMILAILIAAIGCMLINNQTSYEYA